MAKKSIHRLEAKGCEYKDIELPMKSVTDSLEQSSMNGTLSLRTTRFRPSQYGTHNETLKREVWLDGYRSKSILCYLLWSPKFRVDGNI
jgi:hypothetical protein